MADENAFDMDGFYKSLRPHQRAMFDVLGAAVMGGKNIADSAVNAFQTTGRIVRGEPVTDEDVKRGAGDVAGVAMVGSMPFGRPAGAVGSGGNVRLPGVERAMKIGQSVDEPMKMLTMHNATPENLAFASRKYDGQMPVPSIAIARLGHPIEGFGDISLIASPNLAKPSRTNPVYGADAYTKRFPQIEVDVPRAADRKRIIADLEKGGPVGYGAQEEFFDAVKRGGYDLLDSVALARRYLHETGKPLPTPTGDKWDYDMLVRRAARDDGGFKPWAESYVQNLPGDVRERIVKGYSDYDGRKMYAPHTLDNVVKAMKGRADTEGFNYGMGNLRAAVTPTFGTLAEIQAARGRLQPKSEWEPQSQALSNEITALANELPVKYRDSNLFTDANHKFEAIAEAIKRPYSATTELGYQFDASRLPPDIRDRLMDLRKRIQQIPTDYFEAKPQRAVGINEFEAALVPDTTPTSVLDLLHRHGIKRIEGYGKDAPGTREPQARKNALRQFDDLAFSRGGLPMTYGYTPPPPGEVY